MAWLTVYWGMLTHLGYNAYGSCGVGINTAYIYTATAIVYPAGFVARRIFGYVGGVGMGPLCVGRLTMQPSSALFMPWTLASTAGVCLIT